MTFFLLDSSLADLGIKDIFLRFANSPFPLNLNFLLLLHESHVEQKLTSTIRMEKKNDLKIIIDVFNYGVNHVHTTFYLM